MINSEINDSVSHIKVGKTPNNIKIIPLIGTRLGTCFWGGVTVPVIIQLFADDVPVHYVEVEPPVIVSSDFDDITIDNIKQLSANVWDNGEETCELIKLSCYRASLTMNLSGYDVLSSYDACNNLTEYEIPKTLSGDINVSMDLTLGGTIHGGLSSITLSTFDEPFDVQTKYGDKTYLDYLNQFDVIDCNGNGIMFSNPDSKLTAVMKAVFGDEFTTVINQKILNFGDNINSLERSDTNALDVLGENLGVESSGFSDGIPTEIGDIIKLGSIRYEELFGVEDSSLIYNEENIGELVMLDDTVTAGEVLFVRKTNAYEEPYDIFIVPTLNSELLLVDSLVGDTVYELSEVNHPVYDPTTHCFWRNTYDLPETINNIIEIDRLPYIPTKKQWNDLIQKKIEYQLFRNVFV